MIGAGAKPSTLTFTIPDPKIVTDVPTFLKTLVTPEEAFSAAYIVAAQEFAILGQAKYAQVALQIGGVEAEHRAGVRFYAIQAGALTGTPNDVAFEKALFASVGEAAALQKLGFIGGTGTQITYPGPGAIDATGVIERTPGGPVVACAAPAPSASPSPSATPKPSASPSPVPTATPMPSTPTPMPMPGLPNTGGGGGSNGQGTIATLGALGLGAAAAGALALRRNRQSAATGSNDER